MSTPCRATHDTRVHYASIIDVEEDQRATTDTLLDQARDELADATFEQLDAGFPVHECIDDVIGLLSPVVADEFLKAYRYVAAQARVREWMA